MSKQFVRNYPKPYGVGAGRLWLEAHFSQVDPKIGDPYATEILEELDAYIARAINDAVLEERGNCAKIAMSFCVYGGGEGGITINPMVDATKVAHAIHAQTKEADDE